MADVSVCCIGKCENNYIREWVEHYKKYRFYHIYLYDNNDLDGEHFEDVIGDYVESGFVTIIDVRGKVGTERFREGRHSIQVECYNNCYRNYSNCCDWMLFCDIDEFIELENENNINDFITNRKFKSFDIIKLNWKYYDNNDLICVKNNDYSVKRFSRHVGISSQNVFVKSIIKTGLDIKIDSPHGRIVNDENIRICNVLGKKEINEQILNDYRIIHKKAWLNHYRFKTISEYINNKIKRGWPDNHSDSKEKLNIEMFLANNNDKILKKMNLNRTVKNVGVFVGNHPYGITWDEESIYQSRVGGSEIWAIKLCEELRKTGRYNVYCFTDCETLHVGREGVLYIPWRLTSQFIKSTHFEHFITSRRVDVLSEIKVDADDILLMCHDIHLNGKIYDGDFSEIGVNGVLYQSEYQKNTLLERYPKQLSNVKFYYTMEGIEMNDYIGVDLHNKENKMLLSSAKNRGDKLIIEKILPLIRKEVPDFYVEVCGYDIARGDFKDDFYKTDGLKILGKISHKEITEHQKSSKIWIYPSHGLGDDLTIKGETFCITSVENASAGNALILSNHDCFASTLNGYEGFVGDELFIDRDTPLDTKLIDKYAEILAEQAIKVLKDDEYRIKLAQNAIDITSKYTWENDVKLLEATWEEINKN